ncbi:peptidylprolyl isomerase [Phaeobacter gallaeciensis]|uniref:peptidylprolyl isomerase n=1 Tax=Phaeobacter gallaeciensis TaxID=60890 RepID=UPI00237F5F3D|nr:peptidylprolyl isomerase [Phaeobacter gallaeciensis]MDE4096340.1 SurA N-terminal domain-containing protein [Phaeobacter gallaeciensis]MDE4105151.1 SurA N-terminal domain-containing protein [Phaeobacter gallaeciensis]MDE4109607.1 SurA N-terminal domain-containing protein [Phaeobacter gallaeciensis]MDE4114075.1 SurA N-terminal domain-containing protein [Phaeobacter gallaeciensis]MDE4118542.1 SurA N-terminal domain-containing protein [Phaeobacter gallaeciensis]
MAAGMKNLSRTFVWILMGMLIVGLAGFGAVNFTGSMSAVALVGDEEVTVDAYVRELQREQRAMQAQTGQAMPMSQLTAMGLDQVVLGRLITLAAIDNEVSKLGISIGDENLLSELTKVSSFQDSSGQFDRETYRFTLDNAGFTEAEFEDDLRREASRTLVQGAIMSGTKMPEVMSDTLVSYIGERRSFSYVQLSSDDVLLTQEIPDDTALRAFYDDTIADFTLPETKSLTYAHLSPDMLLDTVEVDQEALRGLYEDRADQYLIPERRLVERLVFADNDSAASAKAQLDVSGTTFEVLVQDRGLALSDVDMGDVTEADLANAGAEVFAAEVGDVVGPLPSDLGPALYRVNGRLEARETSFEEAEAELRAELAADRARRVIEQQAESIEDMLAGGVTLEELPDQTDMQLGTLGWTGLNAEGIAAYDGFREAAEAVTVDDFPSVAFLEDGSLFALRLDEVLPPRPEPFEAARDKVLAAWNENRTAEAVNSQAQELLKQTEADGAFPEGHDVQTETAQTRTAYIDTTPVEMMIEVFEMNPGELRTVSGEGSTVVLRLDEVLPAEDTSEEMQMLASAMQTQLDQALSQALFEAFAQDAQLRAAPRVNQQALNAVQANFQ